jgi:hypothetical protein
MKKLNFTIFLLILLAIGPQSVCYAQNPKNVVVDTNKAKQLIVDICANTTKGGDYAILAELFTDTISPYAKRGEVRFGTKIGGAVEKFVDKFPKYVISNPYNFEFLNGTFPLMVKCDVDVIWEKDGVETLASINKTYYITSDYKVSGFEDQELSRNTLCKSQGSKIGAQEECFVKGVSSYALLKQYHAGWYEYRGSNLKVYMFAYQGISMVAQLVDEFGMKTDIPYRDLFEPYWGDGEDPFEEQDRTKVEYVVTQHDFNGDAMDEIVIASRLKDGYAVPVGICIYNIIDGQAWCLEAPATWFDMFISLKGNRIRVEPNHWGFTYDWRFENGKFVDYASY